MPLFICFISHRESPLILSGYRRDWNPSSGGRPIDIIFSRAFRASSRRFGRNTTGFRHTDARGLRRTEVAADVTTLELPRNRIDRFVGSFFHVNIESVFIEISIRIWPIIVTGQFNGQTCFGSSSVSCRFSGPRKSFCRIPNISLRRLTALPYIYFESNNGKPAGVQGGTSL